MSRIEKTGETTRQMLAAPSGSLYIWPLYRSLYYARRLAEHLGKDFVFGTVHGVLEPDVLRKYTSQEFPGVVLDHSCSYLMLGKHHESWKTLQARFPVKKSKSSSKKMVPAPRHRR